MGVSKGLVNRSSINHGLSGASGKLSATFAGRGALGPGLALPGNAAMTLRVRALSDDEAQGLAKMARSRTLGAGLVRRAQIVQHAVDEGLSAPEIATRPELNSTRT